MDNLILQSGVFVYPKLLSTSLLISPEPDPRMKVTIGGLYCLWPAFTSAWAIPPDTSIVNQTTCNGKTYTYNGLAGYGFIPSDARDKFGDTIGAIGSAIAIDQKSWVCTGDGTHQGIIWALPDRGW
jgi:hypothetical protein